MVAESTLINQVIDTYRRATEANRRTRGRHGCIVDLHGQPGSEVMVTADIHGNRLNFDRLLRIADLSGQPMRHLVMQEVCHGGPVYPSSEGCMSHLLLEDVARLKVLYQDRFHFLLSNHEWAEMTDFPIRKASRLLNLSFRTGMQQLYGAATDMVRVAMNEFLASCPVVLRISPEIAVCHSAPARMTEDGFDGSFLLRPLETNDFRPHGELFRLLWGRDFSAANGHAFAESLGAQVLIHGHEPCPDGFAIPNPYQIILDCCGTRGSYVSIPADRSVTHGEVVERICLFESV